ncbi:MAG: exosortase-associated EpsI family protein [Planctomycetia bacterium]|nr:exosortase-associated EpsI family protein [Planctomycetia bacterium]
MFRQAPYLVAFAIVTGAGLLHGLWSDRWQASDAPEVAAERLRSLPLTIGDWEGTEMELDGMQAQRAEIRGSVQRRYAHRASKQEILVVLLCGRPGPIAAHSPEVCYPGSGFQQEAARKKHQVTPAPDAVPMPFWQATFVKEAFPVKEQLRVYWGWNPGDGWKIADEPRMAFARYPMLCKLYLIHRSLAGDGATDPCPEFMNQLLPAVNAALQPTS